ncbi:MAG: flavodoxin [Pseudomonadota bacterium]
MKFGMIYGSTTGNTLDIAERIMDVLDGRVEELLDVYDLDFNQLNDYDVVLVGAPTWDIGELELNWKEALPGLEDVRLDGLKVAFFGDGDQHGYPDNFQDALGILRDLFIARGATADIGHWPTEGYDFDASRGLLDDKFVGLALDELQQEELTDERIERWVGQLLTELDVQ